MGEKKSVFGWSQLVDICNQWQGVISGQCFVFKAWVRS